ncbi:hypothetical protein Sjap_023421 [Stephania japonica]|uniref:Uncharacterized protein n=1 Tax=Stephania japonica TaxID=461633 RepID=A0AAP0EBL7_9MAGN
MEYKTNYHSNPSACISNINYNIIHNQIWHIRKGVNEIITRHHAITTFNLNRARKA